MQCRCLIADCCFHQEPEEHIGEVTMSPETADEMMAELDVPDWESSVLPLLRSDKWNEKAEALKVGIAARLPIHDARVRLIDAVHEMLTHTRRQLKSVSRRTVSRQAATQRHC